PPAPRFDNLSLSNSMNTGMRMPSSASSLTLAMPVPGARSRMSVTEPTSTPLTLTGAPMLSPSTAPGKKTTNRAVLRKKRPDPNIRMPNTPSAIAPRTNAPMIAGVAFLPMGPTLVAVRFPAGEETAHVLASRAQQLLRGTERGHRSLLHVEEQAVGGD